MLAEKRVDRDRQCQWNSKQTRASGSGEGRVTVLTSTATKVLWTFNGCGIFISGWTDFWLVTNWRWLCVSVPVKGGWWTGGGGGLPERLLGSAETHQAENTGRQADASLRSSGPSWPCQPRQPRQPDRKQEVLLHTNFGTFAFTDTTVGILATRFHALPCAYNGKEGVGIDYGRARRNYEVSSCS